MHFIEYYILEITQYLGGIIEHGLEDFCCHYETGSRLIDLHVASYQTDTIEGFVSLEVPILLIRESLYRRRVDHPVDNNDDSSAIGLKLYTK